MSGSLSQFERHAPPAPNGALGVECGKLAQAKPSQVASSSATAAETQLPVEPAIAPAASAVPPSAQRSTEPRAVTNARSGILQNSRIVTRSMGVLMSSSTNKNEPPPNRSPDAAPKVGWDKLAQIHPAPTNAPESQHPPEPTNTTPVSAGPPSALPSTEPAANPKTPRANSPLPLDARSKNDSGVGGGGGIGATRRRHGSRGITRFVVALLLAIHASLLAWQAYRYSPTIDEPAHMAAGISHWKFGRFDLYRVNPPLVRMIAALPMLIVEPKVDWSAFTEAAYARPEFSIGSALANGNGFDIFWDFTLARWACIPFSLIGGYFCYRWGRELYGVRAGIVALILWCFCPNILGNGALITPDVPAAALGVTACYFFWRWLKACDSRRAVATRATEFAAPATAAHHLPSPLDAGVASTSSPLPLDGGGVGGGGAFRSPNEATPPAHSTDSNSTPAALNECHTPVPPSTWPATLLAGLTLGLAELTKSTWIILFALYPAMWLVWTLCRGRSAAAANAHSTDVPRSSLPNWRSKIRNPQSLAQLATILALALYILNLGYGFENTFQPLGKFAFISKTLGGPDAHEKPGNRFADTWLASVPVPVPANYLRGIDVQKYDFEKGKWSYLRGEQKFGGWWYYYLYAMAVKIPAGTLALIGLAFVAAIPWQAGWHKLTALRGKPARSVESPESLMARRADSRMPATAPESRLANSKSKFVLLAPAIVVLVLISSQTGFSRYLRYAIPAFPFLFVFAGGLAATGSLRSNRESAEKARERLTVPATSNPRRVPGRSRRAYRALTAAAIPILLLASATSSLAVFPHDLSYFNEVAGGPLNGAEHLLDANIDWGQDLLELTRWHLIRSEERPLQLRCFGRDYLPAPELAGIATICRDSPLDDAKFPETGSIRKPAAPALYSVSINDLRAYKHNCDDTFRRAGRHSFRHYSNAGYSVIIIRPIDLPNTSPPPHRAF